MAPKEGTILRSVVHAAGELHERRLWNRISSDNGLALILPTEDAPVIAVIVGSAGAEIGLTLYRGEHALRDWLDERESDWPNPELSESTDTIRVSMTPMGDIPKPTRRMLREAGYSKSIAPLFLTKRPGLHAREPDEHEAETLLYAINAIVTAEASDELVLPPAPREAPATLLTLHVSGSPKDPAVAVSHEVYDRGQGVRFAPVPLPASVRALDLTATRWVVGMTPLPRRTGDDERRVFAAICFDMVAGVTVHSHVFRGFNVRAGASTLFAALTGEGKVEWEGLPSEIVFSSRALFESTADGLRQLGVTCTLDERSPAFNELRERLDRRLPREDGEVPLDADFVPDAADLETWLCIDERLITRAVPGMLDKTSLSSNALRMFFGKNTIHFDDLLRIHICHTAVCEWLLTEYRKRRGQRTLAERLLQKPTFEAERELLLGRIESRPSFYRVESVGDREIRLADVVRGGTVVVASMGALGDAHINEILPARVRPAGNFRLLDLLGPPLDPALAEAGFAFLERQGLQLTPEALSQRSYLIGRLWAWWWLYMVLPVTLHNTDGDPLVLHSAVFRIAHPSLLTEQLAKREDVLAPEPGETNWTWIRSDATGRDTHLARLVPSGERLLVEVNSRQRLVRARAWLEQIAGVTFDAAAHRSLDLSTQSTCFDRVPAPADLAPDTRETLSKHLVSHYLAWIDEPLPTLGGHTPRETCRTRDGQLKVQRMIRTLPSVRGLEPPRERMLTELGLS